jgi:hypothetical protein
MERGAERLQDQVLDHSEEVETDQIPMFGGSI